MSIMTVMTKAPAAPTTMNGLRTRTRSEMSPTATSITASTVQYHVLMPLASAVVRLKTTTQYRVRTLTDAK
jgi:hypothetical protein